MSDSQSPNENPFEINQPQLESSISDADVDLGQAAPGVAARASKSFIVLGLVGVAILFLLYNIFGGKSTKNDIKVEPKKITVASKNVEPPPLPTIDAPTPGMPPMGLTPPPSIPAPTTLPKKVNLNPLTPSDDAAEKAQAKARLRSGLFSSGSSGGGGISSLTGDDASSKLGSDSNSQFASMMGSSKLARTKATRITELRRTIAQGRIIEATLESAINTDLPAPIRAIVSRDTYGEDGNTPLIPKGSRLIGSYNTNLTNGQTRVFVIWTRVIRPDGVDVAIDSPLIDSIGQAGVSGQLDTKFQQIFSRAVMASVVNIALAIGSEEIKGGQATTSNTSDGGSQTTGSTTTLATTNALNRLGSTTDSFLQRFMTVPPTILVDQGTKVNVFVNKDILFPGNTAGLRVIE